MKVQILEYEELGPWVAQLRALEAQISYPLDAGGQERFTIDHGADYGAFFHRRGQGRFMIASADDVLVGTLAGCWHQARLGGASVSSLYLGDLKLRPSARGQRVVHQMLGYGLGALFGQRRLRGFELVYGAAMQGQGGDVTRSMRGAHLGRLLTPLATLSLCFAQPEALAMLQGEPERLVGEGLNLSPSARDWTDNAPDKTLRLCSSGQPWRLIHLNQGPGTTRAEEPWADYLRRCGRALSGRGAQLCFALDARQRGALRWLARQGILPGAQCRIYGLWLPYTLRPQRPLDPSWVFMAPCDI